MKPLAAPLFASLFLSSFASVAAEPDETVSAADAKVIIEATQTMMKDGQNCDTHGFDFKTNTVTIDADDLKRRAYWIEQTVNESGGSYHQGYARTKEQCKLTKMPDIKVDMAVVKFWQATVA